MTHLPNRSSGNATPDSYFSKESFALISRTSLPTELIDQPRAPLRLGLEKPKVHQIDQKNPT